MDKKTELNVAYSTPVIFAGGGGMGNFAYHHVKEIYKQGINIKVYAPSRKECDIPKSKFKLNLSPFGFVIPRRIFLNWDLADKWHDSTTSILLEKCNILHTMSGASLETIRRAKKFGAITFLERQNTHALYQDNIVKEEYARYNVLHTLTHSESKLKKAIKEYEETDYIFVPSEFAYNSFIEYGINKDKLILNYYGVDLDIFQPCSKSDDKFRVLFVGMVDLRKGIQYLLSAWNKLKIPNSELVIAGKITASTKEVLKKYNNIDNIKLLGNISEQKKIVSLYQNSSVFVFPSLEEGSALVTYEAMACGLPMITTYNSGSVARENIDAVFVPIRNPDAIKDAILLLYRDKDKRLEMGESARKQVENYSWKKCGEGLINAYTKYEIL